jgi:cytochrome c biogenesis protein CcmG, thiol:disulfide interchange protein DsbE
MSSRARDKERQRRERLQARRAEEARSKKRRRLMLAGGGLLAAGLVAAGVVAVAAGGGGAGSSAAVAPPKLSAKERGALPKPIAKNLAEANQVIDTPIADKLSSLRGVPVVVNQWASWCPNCKFEFPFFQREAKKFEKKVAFLGLDSQDNQGDAEGFLKQYPVIYPSVFDPSASEAASLGAGQSWPTTVFIDPNGQVANVHIGAYATEEQLRADIERYALSNE